jgi:hypothetical protein
VIQKFLTSGHSFLPCDRQFALIENRRKKLQLIEPSDVVDLLRHSRPSQPFIVQEMGLQDFLSFQTLVAACPRPRYLRVTQAMAVKVDRIHPNDIFVKTEHDIDEWDIYESVPQRDISLCVFRQKNEELLPIPNPDLLEDLRTAYAYMPLESREYWQFLFA